MSIRLKVDKGSVSVSAVLRDEAFSGLLKLIEDFESTEQAAPATAQAEAPKDGGAVPDRAAYVKAWMNDHTVSEVLNQITYDTFPEKILLMGAFHETKTNAESWRSADIEARFADAKADAPSNFPRDISSAIRSGFITTVTPRTYRVTKTGWASLATAIARTSIMFQDFEAAKNRPE